MDIVQRLAGLRTRPNIVESLEGSPDPVEQAREFEIQSSSDLGRSFSAGLRGAASGAKNYVGAGLEALGNERAAADWYRAADESAQNAARWAPEIQDYRQVHDLSTGLRYGAGQLGQAVASTLPAIGLTAVSRGLGAGKIGSYLAGASGMMPQEAGETVQTLRNDPEAMKKSAAERFAIATGKGMVNAGLEEAVPWMLGNRVATRAAAKSLGGAARGAAKDVGEAMLGEGVTEGVQEKVGQIAHGYANPNRDTSQDIHDIINATLGGAIGGGGMAAPHTALAHGLDYAAAPGRFVREKAPQAASVALDAVGDATTNIASTLGDRWNDSNLKTILTPSKMPDDVALSGDPEKVRAWEEQDAVTRKEATTAFAQKIIDSPETRAQYKQKAQDFLDGLPGAWEAFAKEHDIQAKKDRAYNAMRQMSEKLSAKLGGAHTSGKFNLQNTTDDLHIFDAVMKHAHPEALDDVRAMHGAYEFMKHYIESGADDPSALAPLSAVFANPAKALSTMHDYMARAGMVERDPSFDKKVAAQANDEMKKQKLARQIVRQNLAVQHGEPSAADIDSLASELRHGLGMTLEGDRLKQFNALAQHVFGVNTDKALEQLGTLDVPGRLTSDYTPGEDKSASLRGDAEQNFGEQAGNSDDVEAKFNGSLVESGPSVSYHGNNQLRVDRGELKNPSFFTTEYPENLAKARAHLEQNPDHSVTALTPHEYMLESGKSAQEVASMLGKLGPEYEGLSPEQAIQKAGATHTMLRVEKAGLNHDPVDLSRGEVRRLIAKTKTSLSSKEKGKTDLTTQDRGSFLIRAVDKETGEVKKEVVSAHDLVRLMMQKKKDGADVTDKTGNAEIGALFAAGVSSLLNHDGVEGIGLRRTDGTEYALKGREFPESFPIYNRGNGNKVTIKDVLGTTNKAHRAEKQTKLDGKEPAPKKETERVGISDYAGMSSRAVAAEYKKNTKEATALAEKLKTAKNERASEALTGRKQAAEAKRDAAHEELLRRRGQVEGEHKASYTKDDETAPKKAAEKGVAETEEMGAGKKDTEREFDEATGEELHPKDSAAKRAVDALDGRIDTLGKQMRVLADEGERTKNAMKKGVLLKEFNKLKEQRKALIAQRDALKAKTEYKLTPEDLKKAEAIPYKGPKAGFKDTKQMRVIASDLGTSTEAVEKATARFERLNELAGLATADPKHAELLQSMAMLLEGALRTGDFSDADRRIARLETALGMDKVSAQKLGDKSMSAETKQEVLDYVAKVRGPQVKTIFEKNIPKGASGLFTKTEDGQRLIGIALTALSPLSVAHHEAMHDFFSELMKNGDEKTIKLLTSAANNPMVLRQIERNLAGEFKALEQLGDPEERAAYMYQFWAAGQLHVGPKVESLFQKIANFIRQTLGLLRDDQKVELILQAFHDGKLIEHSAVGKVLDTLERREAQLNAVREKLLPVARGAMEIAATSEGHLQGSKNPFLRRIGRGFSNAVGSKDKEQGMLQAREQQGNLWGNRLKHAIGDVDRADVDMALEALQKGTLSKDRVAQGIQTGIRKVLDDFHDYLRGAGLDIGHIKNYFPQVWDVAKIQKDAGKFQDLLLEHHRDILQGIADKENERRAEGAEKASIVDTAPKRTAEDVASAIVMRLVDSHGASALTEKENKLGFTPFMASLNKRSLSFLNKEVFHEFEQKDLALTLTSYITQGVHRAEYARRFDDDGAKLQADMGQALEWEKQNNGGDEEKALKAMSGARRAVMAMEGTLGYDISPTFRRLSGAAIVYENYRTLSFALFSNLIDPLGVVVRGGTLNDAYQTFKRGMREVIAGWKGEHIDDEASRMAELVGTIDAGGFFNAMGAISSSIYMYGKTKEWNDKLFRWNGVEGLNRGVRIGATQAAISFIKRHIEAPNEHSKRYLEELYGEGFDPKSVKIENGRLDMDDPRTQQAVMRWVDGAILRPNAAMRPNWMSDPHWALIAHLKTFTYAFQKVILSRAFHEVKHGNYDAMNILALGYVPTMIAADTVRGLIQGLGSTPDWQKGWTLSDHLENGVQRAGLTGVGQFGLDVQHHGLSSLAGPAGEQAVSAVTKPVGETAVAAIPNPFLRQAATFID